MSAWMLVAGWTLVHFVWQGALLALITAVLLRMCRCHAASVRYAIACGGLTVMLAGAMTTATLIQRPSNRSTAAMQRPPDAAAPVRVDVMLPIAIDQAEPPAASWHAGQVEAWFPLIVSAWLFGLMCLLVRAAAGWWRVRRLHQLALSSTVSGWQMSAGRIARRIGLTRTFRIVELAHVDGPLVLGCLRPIVVLPIAAVAQLNAAQVEAILAHELAHVRRHDYLVNLVQTVAETLLFYHPAVWWLSARIRDEREHCCDDVAVAVCGDPIEYAEALAELAAWRQAGAVLAPAATGGSLVNRIRRILAVDESGELQPRGVIGVAVAVVFFGVVASLDVTAQVSAVPSDMPHLEFEVASVKINKSGSDDSNLRLQPGGRITAGNVSLRALIRNVHNLQDFQLVGGPDWVATDRFDIEAKAGREFDPGPTGPAPELIAMMRNLLAERFKLVVHRGTQEMPVFALQVARADGKLGSQLRKSDIDCAELARVKLKPPPAPAPTADNPRPVGPCGARRANGKITIRAGTMAQLAASLASPADRVVVDRTSLPGSFDIDLEWTPDQTAGPSLFTALQEQLGLKLEATRGPVDVLVIDHVERPGPD